MNKLTRVKKVIKWLIFQDIADTDKDLSEKLGYTKSSFSQIINEKVPISDKFIDKLCDLDENINKVWVMTGEGEILINRVENELSNNPNKVYLKKTDKIEDIQTIPLYDFKASAGLVSLFKEKENILDHIRVPNLPKADGAISIVGDSMYPLLKSGDIVIYKTVHNYIENIFWGEMYLLSYSNQGDDIITVKYIQRSDKGEEWVRLVSQNTHHQPKDVKIKYITALALIKASIRINNMY